MVAVPLWWCGRRLDACDTGGVSYPFLKGHGTENDFVLLPDHDGSVHGALSADRVRALCDRRAGIGGDGVLRVIRTERGRWDPTESERSGRSKTEASLLARWPDGYSNTR